MAKAYRGLGVQGGRAGGLQSRVQGGGGRGPREAGQVLHGGLYGQELVMGLEPSTVSGQSKREDWGLSTLRDKQWSDSGGMGSLWGG